MTRALARLREVVRGTVQFDAPLADLTTYRIGGPGDAVLWPDDAEDVQAALALAREEHLPWLALGLGSNVLIRDEGVRGVVLVLGKPLARLTEDAEGPATWRAGAGLPTPLLARRTAKAGLGGVHRLVGVPGTVGGGVYMNAGAHGQEFRDVVRRVELVRADGAFETRAGQDIDWTYRDSRLGDVVVLGATIALTPRDPAQLEREITQHFRWRKQGTPFNQPCCGSVFRNPASSVPAGSGAGGGELRTAGQLIDAAGLKGLRVGGAEVSRVHANYIVNTGDATAADVLAVIEEVRHRVADLFGVALELEVKVIGG